MNKFTMTVTESGSDDVSVHLDFDPPLSEDEGYGETRVAQFFLHILEALKEVKVKEVRHGRS